MSKVDQLEAEISKAKTHIRELGKAVEVAESFESTLDSQTRVEAAQRALELLQDRLREATARENDERVQREHAEAVTELQAIKDEFRDGMASQVFSINEFAEDFQARLDEISPIRARLTVLLGKYQDAYLRAHGERPDGFASRLFHVTTPTAELLGDNRHSLYDATQFALEVARDTLEGGPKSLEMVQASINGAYRSPEGQPPVQRPTVKAIDEAGMTPGKIMAARRGSSGW